MELIDGRSLREMCGIRWRWPAGSLCIQVNSKHERGGGDERIPRGSRYQPLRAGVGFDQLGEAEVGRQRKAMLGALLDMSDDAVEVALADGLVLDVTAELPN
jgi:hypothetical protein